MSAEHAEIEDVLGALARTVDHGPVRIEFEMGSLGLLSETAKSAPLMYRPMLRLMNALVKGRLPEVVVFVGVVDFEGHRCMWGYPGAPNNTTLAVGGRRWQGRTGTPVAALAEQSGFPPFQSPLSLIDVLRGVEKVRAKGQETLNGHSCRRFEAHANLGRAAELAPYDMAVVAERNIMWSDLDRVPVELWVEKRLGRIRRVRLGTDKGALLARLDLLEFEIEPPSDWSFLWLP